MNQSGRKACVIGYPAKHSRSPKLHGYWLNKHAIDGAYLVEEIPPEDFADFVGTLAERGYVGANVTMPHKDAALALSEPDSRATAIEAANTLWIENGVLKSTNTDVEGFLGSLDHSAPGWDARTSSAIVLGAGGAARAVVYGLIERGVANVHVVNRTLSKAQGMRSLFGDAVKPSGWDALPSLLQDTGILVNSTSLGMEGQATLNIDLAPLPDDAVVSDIVYVPLKTPLLEAAEARGLATSNGLDMLLHQAVTGFEKWFGVRPEVTKEQYELLAEDIRNGG